MCEFISWIEKDGKNYFLTSADLASKRGQQLRRHCKNDDDLVGHGAIRWFYGEFKDGIDKECTDFTDPLNFPEDITCAIKNGSFRGLGLPVELLSQPALADYEKIRQPALADYEKIQQSALADYEKIRQSAFWDLFALESNRTMRWR